MKEILKRLEIIKSCISIEDEESLFSQVNRLKSLEIDSDVKEIIKLIENTDFQKVINMIEQYISKFNSLVVFEDKEIQGLKLELKVLEKELLRLSCELEDYHSQINSFNSKYHKELGVLIEEILILREEYFEILYQSDKQKYEYEYFEAKKDFENFHEESKRFKIDSPLELSKKEKAELKRLYKKASKLCHPDIIEESKREEAENIFKDLNAAYQQNDIKRVSDILNTLLRGENYSFESDVLFDRKVLKNKIEITRDKIKVVQTEIEVIKRDETYILINDIDSIEEYIYRTKKDLKEEKEAILRKIKNYKETCKGI